MIGEFKMLEAKVVSREEWLSERRALLDKEKSYTKLKDEITAQRQNLPWVKLDNEYLFDTVSGEKSLNELFQGKSQLIIYHFMFGSDWKQGCVSCSYWADTFNGLSPHLAARDTTFIVVSSAPLDKIIEFKRRMGWEFEWVSSNQNTFNADFNVGFGGMHKNTKPLMYNFKEIESSPMDEMHGTSVFARTGEDELYHTYSTYGRGLEITNATYTYLDLTPKGRDENGNGMSWLRHHDKY